MGEQVTGLRAQPTGPGVWASRRWVQASGLCGLQAGGSTTPAGWVGAGVGEVALRDRCAETLAGGGHGPGRLPGRAPLRPWRPCRRWRAILRRQVGPGAGCGSPPTGCASVTSRRRPASELLPGGRKLRTVPCHVPRGPFNRAAGEAAARRAQRPLQSEGPHLGGARGRP